MSVGNSIVIPRSGPLLFASAFALLSAGLLRVVVYGAIPINEDGVLLNLRFLAVGAEGTVSQLTFERIMFNEGDPAANLVIGIIKVSAVEID
ncbi:MAG: hypothetical protein IPL32_15880 [Chloracidobacterium sp.]|nr:hypothetical protein [Chloracidobacterium sp.]